MFLFKTPEKEREREGEKVGTREEVFDFVYRD